MANTYQLIEAKTLSSNATSVTFSSIPATYTDLQFVCSVRCADGAYGNYFVYFNATGNASSKVLSGDGAAASSASGYGPATYLTMGTLNSAGQTANTFNSASVYIPNYASSNFKSISVENVTETNATTAYAQINAGLWSSTSAINTLVIYADGSNMVQYSTFYLYGIKNS